MTKSRPKTARERKPRLTQPKFEAVIEIVGSTWIKNIQYDVATKILDAELLKGGRYRYRGVNVADFTSVVCAGSSGAAFNKVIKGKYGHTKLPPAKKSSPQNSTPNEAAETMKALLGLYYRGVSYDDLSHEERAIVSEREYTVLHGWLNRE